jgi:hypothetical protein
MTAPLFGNLPDVKRQVDERAFERLMPFMSVAPDLVKVGAEGYIHGWICVRPPCGKTGDEVSHPDHGEGKITSADENGKLHAKFADGVERVLGSEHKVHVGTVKEDDLSVKDDGSVIHKPTGKSIGTITREDTKWGTTYTPTTATGRSASSYDSQKKALDVLVKAHNTDAGDMSVESHATVTPGKLNGSLSDHLNAADYADMHAIINKNATSLKEDDPALKRLTDLKQKSLGSMLKSAGLPDDAAFFISGGYKGDSSKYTARNVMAAWTSSGGENADNVSKLFDKSEKQSSPPDVKPGDFLTRGTNRYTGIIWEDESPEAEARRDAVSSYWIPRVQSHYAQQVMNDAGITKPFQANRGIYGDYAKQIMQAGPDWQADNRALSSWADNKAVPRIDKLMKKIIPADDQPIVWLHATVPVSQVYAHWRGEPTMRVAKINDFAEVVLKNQAVSSSTVKWDQIP